MDEKKFNKTCGKRLPNGQKERVAIFLGKNAAKVYDLLKRFQKDWDDCFESIDWNLEINLDVELRLFFETLVNQALRKTLTKRQFELAFTGWSQNERRKVPNIFWEAILAMCERHRGTFKAKDPFVHPVVRDLKNLADFVASTFGDGQFSKALEKESKKIAKELQNQKELKLSKQIEKTKKEKAFSKEELGELLKNI